MVKYEKPVIKKAAEMEAGDIFRCSYGDYNNIVEVVFEKCEADGVNGTSTKITVHYIGRDQSFDMYTLDPIDKATFDVVGKVS